MNQPSAPNGDLRLVAYFGYEESDLGDPRTPRPRNSSVSSPSRAHRPHWHYAVTLFDLRQHRRPYRVVSEGNASFGICDTKTTMLRYCSSCWQRRARYQAWRKLAPEQMRQFVRAVIVRITVALDTIVIALNKCALRSVLLPAVTHRASAASEDDEDDLIELTIEARVQRSGRSVRWVVTPLEASATEAQQDRALIELLAQGHRWLEQWLRGEVTSLRAIANSAGKSERHVSQVIRAAFLAPDLVEAILQGRQPARLTLRQVMKKLPWDWSEQRRWFGLAPAINDTLSVCDSPGRSRSGLAEIL